MALCKAVQMHDKMDGGVELQVNTLLNVRSEVVVEDGLCRALEDGRWAQGRKEGLAQTALHVWCRLAA